MISATHTLIGETILSTIKQEVDFYICDENFIKGCIKPDYSLRYFFIPHYKDKSFNFIMNMIEDLFEFKGNNISSFKHFSTKLGIIIHFLSDYFCMAHNDKKLDNLITHFRYERQLHHEFLKLPIKDILFNTLEKLNYSRFHISPIFLIEYINEKHYSYLNSKPSKENDIFFAIDVCTATIYSIIKSCQLNKVHKAA